MKFGKRIASVVLAATMLLAPTQLFAAEAVDMPAPWALKEVYLSEAYGLLPYEVESGFQATVSYSDFSLIYSAFCAELGVTDVLPQPTNGVVTRGYVLQALYIAISDSQWLPDDASDSALAFFVEKGLIAGRASGDYALDAPCTTQEALMFAKRAFEHIVYSVTGGSKGFLWRVSDEDNTLYLLGSIHITNRGTYPLSRAIMNAYEDAEHIAVEYDIVNADQDELSDEMDQYFTYTDGTLLSDVLDAETYADFAGRMAEYGIGQDVYANWRPIYADQVLSQLMLGFSFTTGIDEFMIINAMIDGKPIHSIEQVSDQLGGFRDMPLEAQIESLQYTLSIDPELPAASLDFLVSIWREGDDAMLMWYTGLDEENDAYDEALMGDRNAQMIEVAKSMLEGTATDRGIAATDDVLFITGAAHMLGNDGIVAGLQELGYTVERLR